MYCSAAKCTCKGTTRYSYHPRRGGSLYRNLWKKLEAGFTRDEVRFEVIIRRVELHFQPLNVCCKV